VARALPSLRPRPRRSHFLRIGIRSANLDGDVGAVQRMSDRAWVDSCQLVRGVPAELLDILGVRECGSGSVTWNKEAAEHLGITFEFQTEQVARPLTLVQAARRLGHELDHQTLKAMRHAAIATVTENQLRRRAQEAGATP
jgi:hypothetical protein